ncbi:hypothetical protein INR49_022219 [Caranx melampygus]|nr:hypothetical protein INR49_022219 [Caranx melampygus]
MCCGVRQLCAAREDDSDGDLVVAADYGKKRSYAETARMFKLRRNLDQLDCFHRQKEHDVLKAREELKFCRQNIQSLVEQRDDLEKEIEQQNAADNSVAVFRLRAQHKHLCQKLQSEEELEGHVNTELKQLELELSEVEVELGRYSSLRQEVQEEEQVFQVLKAQKAATRLQQEKKASQNLKLKMQQLRNKQAAEMKKEESESQKRSEERQANHKKAAKYLKETIKRMHQREAEKEQQNRELLEKRMQAVTSLKSNIAATQESLRVRQRRAKANAQKKEQQQRQIRESMQTQGITIIKHLHQEEHLEKIKRKQEEFEERRKSNKVGIVAKLLQEEQLARSRKKHQMKLPKLLATDKFPSLQSQELNDISSSSSSSSSDAEDPEETMQQGVELRSLADSLAEPEFSGLWDQNYEKVLNDKTSVVQTEVRQEEPAVISEKSMSPAGRVHGKGLRGSPFISKPVVVLFKINEDLEGEIQFASAGGPFSVPVRCTIKKCDLVVDSQFINFGSHVIGQTISQSITLTNKGALATQFSLDTAAKPSPDRSHAQLPSQDSAHTSQETSSQNTTSDSKKRCASTASTEIPPQQEDRQELSEASQDHKPDEVSEAPAAALEDVPQACVSAEAEVQVERSPSDNNDISLGTVREGEIGPFESIKLEVVFTPTVPGEARLDFHIKFTDTSSKPIPIQVRGTAVSIPVWVVQPNIYLKICMFDLLYQDTIVVQSRRMFDGSLITLDPFYDRASTALKVTFDVCPEMRKHMEILPKTGFIQAQSRFNAQLKFLPRHSLSKDANQFFDSDTGVLEVPLTVQVAGQVQPVRYTVQAVVTSSDLRFDRTEVNFGFCSIHQSVRSRVRLTNMSLLPQDFGFLGVPEFIEVQPNNGFGTLLPQETLDIDLIFSANKAKEFRFQLRCKSGINRDFLLSCRAVGVRPPLRLSHSLVHFGATAVGDRSITVLYLDNHGISRHQAKQPVTPVVKGAVAPAAPRLFCFTPPKDSDVSITPSTGRLLPGERCLVQVTFRPRLLEQEIQEEALRRLYQARLIRETEAEMNKQAQQENNNNKKLDKTTTEKLPETLNPADVQPGSELYEEARAALLCSFTQSYKEFIIPCFVSDSDPPEDDRQAQPPWSPLNTLYLKLQCPAVRPSLLLASNHGNSGIDFHQVAVGEKVIKRFTVQNISKESVDLRSSVLDVHGPFDLLNALRSIRPGEKHTVVLAFSPTQEKMYCETLQIHDQKTTLEVTLCGEGVVPVVTSSHPGGLLDFGYVMEKERTSQVIKLQNSSAVTVRFRALLASLSPSRPQGGTDSVGFLLGIHTDSQVQPTVAELEVMEKPSIPVLVTLRASYSEGVLTPAVRELHVGCICSTQPSKKSAEFSWDNVASLQQLGFSVEPSKGVVEPGHKCTITVTWTPQSGYMPSEVVRSCVSLTLKGDERHVYRVTLMASVSTNAE